MDGLTYLYMGYVGYWLYMDGNTYICMGYIRYMGYGFYMDGPAYFYAGYMKHLLHMDSLSVRKTSFICFLSVFFLDGDQRTDRKLVKHQMEHTCLFSVLYRDLCPRIQFWKTWRNHSVQISRPTKHMYTYIYIHIKKDVYIYIYI